MDQLLQDVRQAARALWRAPGFSAIAIVTLALGLGATSAIYSVVRAALLAPLPWSQPDSRVMIWSRWVGFDKTWVSGAEVQDYRRARSFTNVAAWSSDHVNLTGSGGPERVGSAACTANIFEVLGARPLYGRGFEKNEDASGDGAPVVVLSYSLWQRRYAGDPRIVGRNIQIDGRGRQVVGVMPKDFKLPTDFGEDFEEPSELWTPLVLDFTIRGNHGYYAAASLADGVSAASASAEVAAIARQNTAQGLYPAAMHFDPFAISLTDQVLAPARPALLLLSVATALLLLVACANVGNLLLARAEQRRRELALRAALGAGQWRLVRYILTETLVLAMAGGLLGIGVAWMGARLVALSGISGIPRAADVRVDGPVLLFALGATCLTAVVCGLLPAFRPAKANLTESLKDGAQNATAGSARQRVRAALVVAEMALAVLLLVCAGLVLRSLWALQQVRLGFEPRGVLTLRLAPPEASYASDAQVQHFYQELVGRVRALPGVSSAGAVRSLPLANTIGDWGVDVEGYQPTPGREAKGDWQVATDGSFEALGERLVSGRWFTSADREDSQPVAVVNETMAKRYWADGNPLGRRIRLGGADKGRPWATVVGVVGDLQHNGLESMVKEKFYVPHSQFGRSTGFTPRYMTLVVRTAGDPVSLAPSVREQVRQMDPNLPIAAVRPMTDVVASAASMPRFTSALLSIFSALALCLAAIGIYGVLAYLVSQRTREIGIRMAIGARPSSVLGLIVGRGLALSLSGVVLGLMAAAAASRLMTGLLFHVQPLDVATFLAAPAILVGVSVLSSAVPAWRAMRVDPITALRTE